MKIKPGLLHSAERDRGTDGGKSHDLVIPIDLFLLLINNGNHNTSDSK